MSNSDHPKLGDVILKTRKLITENGGDRNFTQEANKRYGRGHGFTKSSITKLLKKVREIEEKKEEVPRNLQVKIADYQKAVNTYVVRSQGNTRHFYNTMWYIYFFYYHRFAGQQAKLGRAAMEIDESGSVTVRNVPDGISSNYHGKFELVNDNVLFFNLIGDKATDRIHFKVVSGPQPREIALGISSTFEQGTVIAGTLVMQQQNVADFGRLIPGSFTYQDEEFEGISKPIREFLSNKTFNRLKIPSDVRTEEQLERFVKKYEIVKDRLFYEPELPGLAIASPADSVLDEQYDHKAKSETVEALLEDVRGILEKSNIEIGDISYPGKHNAQSAPDILEYRRVTAHSLYGLRKTSFFVMIYDERAISKAFVELGYALSVCKAVLVLYRIEQGFPESLASLVSDSRFAVFRMQPFSGTIQEKRPLLTEAIVNLILDNVHYSEQ